MEIRRRIPIRVWHVVRVVSVCAYISLCIALFVRPAGGLFWFFKVVVPLLPITFFVAPGLWRNVCPLAASNQAPRTSSASRAASHPPNGCAAMAMSLPLCCSLVSPVPVWPFSTWGPGPRVSCSC